MPVDLTFDASAADTSGGRLHQTAWGLAPPPDAPIRGLMVCLAGGKYDKHYWHLEVPGHPGYSFAAHVSATGWVVVALDHLGVGASSDPPGPIGLERLRAGDAVAIQRIVEQFVEGTLLDGIGPAPSAPIIGVGHSMGACLVVMLQATERPFDAVALLGYGIHTEGLRDEFGPLDDLEARIAAAEARLRELAAAGDADVHVWPRAHLRQRFHAADVPDAVIDADDAVASRVPVRAVAEVTTLGVIQDESARIDVPVYLCFGSVVDGSLDPYLQPACFRSANDITLTLLEGSAHCHNMAGRRVSHWEHLARWATR